MGPIQLPQALSWNLPSSPGPTGAGDTSVLGTSAQAGPSGEHPVLLDLRPGTPPAPQPLVIRPSIPINCTPQRPRSARPSTEPTQLDLSACGMTDIDQELLDSSRTVQSSLPAGGQVSPTVSAPPGKTHLWFSRCSHLWAACIFGLSSFI